MSMVIGSYRGKGPDFAENIITVEAPFATPALINTAEGINPSLVSSDTSVISVSACIILITQETRSHLEASQIP